MVQKWLAYAAMQAACSPASSGVVETTNTWPIVLPGLGSLKSHLAQRHKLSCLRTGRPLPVYSGVILGQSIALWREYSNRAWRKRTYMSTVTSRSSSLFESWLLKELDVNPRCCSARLVTAGGLRRLVSPTRNHSLAISPNHTCIIVCLHE